MTITLWTGTIQGILPVSHVNSTAGEDECKIRLCGQKLFKIKKKNPTIHNFRSDHSIICWILKNEDKWKKEMKYHTNTRIHGPGTGIFDIFKKLWFWIEIIISKLAKTRYHFHKFDLNLTFEVHAPTTTASRRRSSSKAPFCDIYANQKF